MSSTSRASTAPAPAGRVRRRGRSGVEKRVHVRPVGRLRQVRAVLAEALADRGLAAGAGIAGGEHWEPGERIDRPSARAATARRWPSSVRGVSRSAVVANGKASAPTVSRRSAGATARSGRRSARGGSIGGMVGPISSAPGAAGIAWAP